MSNAPKIIRVDSAHELRREKSCMLVSIGLCTYNRAFAVDKTLDSLTRIEVPEGIELEILVVDNASTDNTREVIEAFALRSPYPVRYLLETKPGVAAARNRAIREFRGEWLAQLDDDEVAERDWLIAHLEYMKSTGAKIATGSYLVRDEEGNRIDKPLSILRIFGESGFRTEPAILGPYESPAAGNLFIHRSIFELVPGYDEGMTEAGEDTEFGRACREKGIEVHFNPKAKILHLIPARRFQPEFLCRDSIRVGWSFARRDQRDRGAIGYFVRCGMRGVKTALVFFPFWIATSMTRSDKAVGHQVNIYRNLGYFQAWRLLFGIHGSKSQPNFRQERTIQNVPRKPK